MLGLLRYCLGGKGGGDVHVGDDIPNTGDVTVVRFLDGKGGGSSVLLEELLKLCNVPPSAVPTDCEEEVQEEEEEEAVEGKVWAAAAAAIRVGRVDNGGGGGGVAKS